ncbi:hypothetical protein FPV67DRAFT_1680711 [Lyophyllum atratum]|nr:hypothetical protein FPV67DRAFT_1680711 [Lyophyllum atratum]
MTGAKDIDHVVERMLFYTPRYRKFYLAILFADECPHAFAVSVPLDLGVHDASHVDDLALEWWVNRSQLRRRLLHETLHHRLDTTHWDEIYGGFTVVFEIQDGTGLQNTFVASRRPGVQWYGNILVVKNSPDGSVDNISLPDRAIVEDMVLSFVSKYESV